VKRGPDLCRECDYSVLETMDAIYKGVQ
jgi:hypothetical protein